MHTLSLADAIYLVRKNFDEEELNDSIMADTDDSDSEQFDSLVKAHMPEAINAVHASAPLELLDGKTLTTASASGDTCTFTIASEYLRIIRCVGNGSSVVLTKAYDESTPEAHMQLNPFTKGDASNPCLVARGRKKFTFYGASSISSFEYVPRYSKGVTSADVAERVADNIIDELTGRMMLAYGLGERANIYLQRARDFGQPAGNNQQS